MDQSIRNLNPSVFLQGERDQAASSQDVASGGKTRFLWTGIGFAVLMLIGVLACALRPVDPHASAQPSRLVPDLAFNPILRAPPQAFTHPVQPGHIRSVRPTISSFPTGHSQAYGKGVRASGVSRRAVVRSIGAAAVGGVVSPVLANSDPTLTAVSTQTGADFVSLPSGIKVKDIRSGTGPQAQKGDTVSVQLSGRCLNLNGKKFISTQDPATLVTGLQVSEPYIFTLGSGSVIPGLEAAVEGMAKGAYRRAVIPASLGYDAALTLGPQPQSFMELRSLESIVKNPNRDASLLFDVQLERIKR